MSFKPSKTKILMVCLGNICRSPLAHGILESKLPKEHFYIDSAGTAAYHVGEKPDHRSIAVAKSKGIDISSQKARQFSEVDFERFDVIYAMDQSNYQNILHLAQSESDKRKVKLILNELSAKSNSEVPDPYYGGDKGFENVYHMLDEACDVIADKLLN